jgi:hypothetical protein
MLEWQVGVLTSNIRVTAMDALATSAPGGEMFGCRVIVNGPSVLRMSGAALEYCGQAGLMRPALLLDRLTPLTTAALGNVTGGRAWLSAEQAHTIGARLAVKQIPANLCADFPL